MVENLIVMVVILLITTLSKDKSLGILICAYYVAYILIELDFFGYTVGNVFSQHDEFTVWYLICTAIACLFSIISTCLYLQGNKYACLYSLWLLINALISGFMAVMQSLETNTGLFVYNTIQNINLPIELLIVTLGTDNPLRRIESATYIVNSIDNCVDSWVGRLSDYCDTGTKCHTKISSS